MRKFLKIFTLLLAACVLLTLTAVQVFAADTPAGTEADISPAGLSGEGTEDSPYLIESLADLIWFRDKVDEQAADGSTQFAGKYFKLTTNIDLAGINWNPIGSKTDDRRGSFKGVFDGDGHTIFNLYVEQAGDGLGLFAHTTGNAVIKNLNLENVTVKSTNNSNHVGGLVGNAFASTKIENVHVTGEVYISGRGYIGGLVGHGYVVMDNVSVKANNGGLITSTFWCAGGILGYAGEGSTNIMNAHVEGVTVTSAAGGLGAIVGMAEDNEGTQPISGSNLSAKNVEIKTYRGIYGDYYADYAIGYLYGGSTISKLTGTLTVENVAIDTFTGEAPSKISDAAATIGNTIYFDLQTALNNVAEGEIIVLLKDVTVTTPAHGENALNHARAVSFTLDLNGKTLSADTGNSVFRFNLADSGATEDVTVLIKNGKIVSGSNTWSTVMAAGIDGAKAILNLNGVTIENSKPGDLAVKAWEYGIVNATDVVVNSTKGAGGFYAVGGEIVLDNCTVTQTGLHTAPYNSMAFAVSYGGKMTIESGTYSSEPTAAAEGNGQGSSHGSWVGGVMNSGGTLIINDGTFSNGNYGEDSLATSARGLIFADTYGVVEVNGGTFNALKGIFDCQNNLGIVEGNPVITVKGGTYSADPSEGSCVTIAEGYVVAKNDDDTYTVKTNVDLVITTAEDLFAFAKSVNEGNTYAGKRVVLAANIDLKGSENPWTPIGASADSNSKFRGTFDGQGHTIFNLYVKQGAGYHAAGFFGATNGVIKNFTIENAYVENLSSGNAQGATVNGTAVVAGSTAYGATIENVHVVTATVKGNRYVAGIVGYMDGIVTNCSVKDITLIATPDNLTGSYDNGDKVGGIVGYTNSNATEISGCKLLGTVDITAYRDIGGLVGSVQSCVVVSDNTNDAAVKITVDQVTNSYGTKDANANEFIGRNTPAAGSGNNVPTENASFVKETVTATVMIGSTPYATLAEAIAEAKEGDVIQLLAGTFEEGTIKLPAALKNVTIKGAADHASILKDMKIMSSDGNTISYEGITIDGIVFENSYIVITGWRTGEVLNKDWTVTNCIFRNIDNADNEAAVHFNLGASEAVDGFTFTNNVIDGATGGSKSGLYLQATNNVIVTGNVINNVAFRPYVIQLTTDDGVADTFIVENNTFSGSAAGRAQALGSNGEGTDAVTLTVNNNIFKDITNAQQICYWNFNTETTTADISKNYYDIDILANPGSIYFNSSAQDVADLVEMGVFPYYAELNEDGTINTESLVEAPVDAVAEINGKGYADLQTAINEAEDGDVITIVKNFDLTTSVTIPADKNITIDLNGMTITGTDNNVTGNFYLLDIRKGVLTVEDNVGGGKITLTATTNRNTSAASAVIGNEQGSLRIVGGTIEHLGGTYMAYAIDNLTNGGQTIADLVIEGGSVQSSYRAIRQFANGGLSNNLTITNGNVGEVWMQSPNSDVNFATINISGGTVKGVRLTGASANLSMTIAPGTTGDVFGTAPAGFAIYGSPETGFGLVKAVVTIGSVGYATLQDAVDAAKEGDVLVLAENIVLEDTVTIPADKNITIDLNSKTISQEKACTAHYGMIENRGTLTIIGEGAISFKDTGAGDPNFNWGSYTIINRGTLVVGSSDATVGAPTIENLSGQSSHCYIAIQQSMGTTTIHNGTVSTPNYRSVRVNKGSLIINGGTFNGQVWIQPNQGDSSIVVNGGEFTPKGNDASAIFMTNAGENYTVSSAEITDGVFNGKIGCTVPANLADSITGGSFSATAKANTSADLLADGCVFGDVADANGYYKVVEYAVIKSARVGLGSSLAVQYAVMLDASIDPSKVSVEFVINPDDETLKKTVVATKYTTSDQLPGYYIFTFTDIAPTQMGDLINATIYIDETPDGAEETVLTPYGTLEGYSIKQNLLNVEEKNYAKAGLTELVARTLEYGAAAQNYRTYKTDALVTYGVDNERIVAVFTSEKKLPGVDAQFAITPPEYSTDMLMSASVGFSDTNKLIIKFTSSVAVTTENMKDIIVVKDANGKDVAYTLQSFGNDNYSIEIGPIAATRLTDKYTITTYKDNAVNQTLTYGIPSYVYGMQNDAETGELAVALYNYGLAAIAFAKPSAS